MKPTTRLAEKKTPALKAPLFELLVVIVNRGRGPEVTEFLQNYGTKLSVLSFGDGTAPSNLSDLLNYSQEKEVVFAVVNLTNLTALLDDLESKFLTKEKYSGIAFTIPLKSMTNIAIDQLKGAK